MTHRPADDRSGLFRPIEFGRHEKLEQWHGLQTPHEIMDPQALLVPERHVTDPRFIPSDERIVDAMIQFGRAAKLHRMIVTGHQSPQTLLELHRRGYLRVTAAALCDLPCGQFDMALVAWRERSIKALETALEELVHFLSTAGVLVVWVGARDRIPIRVLRLALERLGFRIDAGTNCETGVAISARRSESTQSPRSREQLQCWPATLARNQSPANSRARNGVLVLSRRTRPKVPMRRRGADCPVVVMKRGNARGAKGAGHRR
jgi:hypothetical protein